MAIRPFLRLSSLVLVTSVIAREPAPAYADGACAG
jgi:hypothetical protein